MPVEQRQYRFQNVDVDVANLQITVDGAVRPLEPKAFRVLQFLIENSGRAVPKDEILAAVWPNTAVTDNALTRAIAQIRKALDDDSKEPRFIETVPTVGYRFIAQPDPQPALIPAPTPKQHPRTALFLFAGLAAIAVAVFAFRQPAQPPRSPNPFKSNVQLTAATGLDLNATFSPDGNLIAYASDRSGSFEIYVRTLEGGARDTQVTTNGFGNLAPAWSPDGQSIVYSAAKPAGIYRVPTLGGSVQRLTTFGSLPSWSPDGKWIAFASHARPTLSTTDYYWPADSTLWIVPATGGTPREITTVNGPLGGQTFPSWSPDSSEIRFVNYVGNIPSLWTWRMFDGALRKRFELTAGSTLGNAVFSKDNRRIFYVSCKLNGEIGIWRVPLDPETLAPTAAPELIYQPSIGSPRDITLSPDGTRLGYSAIIATSQILTQSVESGKPTVVSQETGYRHTMPVWSPDGKQLLYTTLPIGRPAQSRIDNLDGKPSVALGRGTESQHYPHYLPGGKTVRFLTSGQGQFAKIQDISIADGAIVEYPAPPGMSQPSFAPDGLSIVYHAGDGTPQVFEVDLQSRQAKQLTAGPGAHAFAHYSSDRKWIAYERMKRGGTEIWIVPSGGGTPESVVVDPGTWYSCGWSADARRILVAGNEGGGWALYSVDRQTRKRQRITSELPLRAYVRYPRWSPDEKRIAYEYNESKGNVFLAELAE